MLVVTEAPGQACRADAPETSRCGWNAYCDGAVCKCYPGFRWTHNRRDCYDSKYSTVVLQSVSC